MTLWDELVKQLEQRLGAQNVETWIRPIRVHTTQPGNLTLEVPNKFFRDWLEEHFLVTIQDTIHSLTDGGTKISIVVGPPADRSPEARPQQSVSPAGAMRHLNLVPKYTFANFVVGASNQFAHASCLAVANQPGDHYNPLFLYGGVGLGKTHLVNAIGHNILARKHDVKVVYLASESFMTELIASLRRDRMDQFKAHFRNIDMLILDDVQFLAGKERTQEEFFHTFNSLYEAHKQIVITSDRFPKEIPGLEDRLRNRFEWGLIADIQPPDMETRVAILQKKAEMENVNLPHDVAIFIASNITSNVRELEGSLTRLGAFASLTKTTITIDLAKEVLQNTLKGLHREVTIENIQKIICEHFNLKLGELKSKRRTKNIALPRQMAMYLCRKHTSTSFPTIGDKFGGRDHSTVIHASKTIEEKIKQDPYVQATIDILTKSLKL
ncbi:MAG: chromosomal replication initiator protein DnaA [Deltaproteobacteria bacterium]|nr:chromosomal replication initiator protein DnaA [Deltaproteobacteria bacterium]